MRINLDVGSPPRIHTPLLTPQSPRQTYTPTAASRPAASSPALQPPLHASPLAASSLNVPVPGAPPGGSLPAPPAGSFPSSCPLHWTWYFVSQTVGRTPRQKITYVVHHHVQLSPYTLLFTSLCYRASEPHQRRSHWRESRSLTVVHRYPCPCCRPTQDDRPDDHVGG